MPLFGFDLALPYVRFFDNIGTMLTVTVKDYCGLNVIWYVI